ncbi:MAG: hypothetical protein AUG49_14635 [Catenulispora sp. 13_1_20CM_3_70_7]|nr:MAG: hypothetical protein AUG49_14635 [Catenulispora sp. 13_1_20CM_3_70_7]
MKADIPSTTLDRVTVERIDIGHLNLGPLTVGRLVLDGARVDVSTGAARFAGLRVSIGLTMTVRWKVEVSIPLVGSWGWDGTIDLGTTSIAVPLPDVTLPGLESFSLNLSEVAVDDLRAVVGPLSGLRLGPLVAEQVQLSDVLAPVAGFDLLGAALGRIALEGLSLPSARADAQVGRVHGQALPLGSVTVANLALPSAAGSDIASEGLDVQAEANPIRFEADAGILSLTLEVRPSAGLQADELRLTNVRASGAIDSMQLHDAVLPYEVLNLSLSDIGVESIDVAKLEVS